MAFRLMRWGIWCETIKLDMTPYSDNLIFFDTEFTTLDPSRGQLLSVGLVKYQEGSELYLELEYDTSTVEPWVAKRVIPLLTEKKHSPESARKIITEFVGEVEKEKDKPFLVSYVNQFDAIYWYKLFNSPKDHPVFWIPIDFASILFAYGYAPNSLGRHKFYKELGVDKKKYREHNALDDARLLRDVYMALIQKV